MNSVKDLRIGSVLFRKKINRRGSMSSGFLIWGTGELSGRLLNTLSFSQKKKIIGFIESRPTRKRAYNKEIYSPEKLSAFVGPTEIFITSSYIDEIIRSKHFANIKKQGFVFYKLVPASFAALYSHKLNSLISRTISTIPSCAQKLTVTSTKLIKFSIVIPTFNSDPFFLRQAVNSVTLNSYPYHEIIISDDDSSSPMTKKELMMLEASVDRLIVIRQARRLGIAQNTNCALEIVSGDYVVFLDHDDRLSGEALGLMAQAISENSTKRFFYSDEDKVTMQGIHFDPYLKTGFDEVLLRVQNCVSHMSVVDADTLREVGFLDSTYDGSQDWALVAEIFLRFGREAFHHVPEILYHWRTVPGSAASGGGAKSWADVAGKRLVEDKLLLNTSLARIDHEATTFSRLTVGRLPELDIYLAPYLPADGHLQCQLIENPQEGVRLRCKILEGPKNRNIVCYVNDLLSQTELSDAACLLVVPRLGPPLSWKNILELYTVCLMSASGIATSERPGKEDKPASSLSDDRYTKYNLKFFEPTWLMKVQRSVDRCWVDYFMVKIGRAREKGLVREMKTLCDYTFGHQRGERNLIGYTPYAKGLQ